ncbi:MAG TPA: amidohydrolase family protein [Xanthobacteraceae bacterium]|nr:amidohydrolase family protein [Xanthobacteraceae bacterium]
MLIDSHCHVIATDTKRYPLKPLFGKQSDWSSAHPLDYPDMVKAADEAGIAKSILVQASSAYGFDNSYVADSVAAHPERFVGVFSIDVNAPDAVQKMKELLGRGFVGLRIFTSGSTHAEQETFFAEDSAFPVWRYADDNRIPVCMQMRMPGIPHLEKVLKRFAKVPVIIDHFARAEADDGPPYAKAGPLFALARYPNVYLKITHRPIEQAMKGRATPESFLGRAVQEFGTERLIWGSNFPAAKPPLPELVAMARRALAFLPPADQDWIFFKTAQKLYPALKN